MSRELNADEIKEVLSLRREDVDVDFIKGWFTASDFTSKPRFSPTDRFKLIHDTYFNKEDIETTIGRYFVNVFVFPKSFLRLHGYINVPLTKKVYNALENEMGSYLLNHDMSVEDYKEYVDNASWLFLGQSYLLNPSMTADLVIPIDEVIEDRDKMFEDNAEKIAVNDPATIDKIESTLTKKAEKILKDKHIDAMDYYESGIASFGNVYKKTAIMVGALVNPANGEATMIKSNFTDGLNKNEYGTASHLTVTGGYSRTEGTKVSGYTTKKILNTTFGLELDDAGSDCGTPYTFTIELTKANKDAFLDRYIVDNGNLVLLDYKTLPKYIGKTVQMRSPLYCHGEHICNKCAGEQYYRMGTKNVGMHASAIGGTLLNLGMQKFHDASIHYYTLDVDNFID